MSSGDRVRLAQTRTSSHASAQTSREFVRELVRTVRGLRVRCRQVSAASAMGAMGKRFDAVERVQLDQLSDEALEELITALIGELDYFETELALQGARADLDAELRVRPVPGEPGTACGGRQSAPSQER